MGGEKTPWQQDIKIATDAVIFAVRDDKLNVLLIQIKKKPFSGRWALPGGLIGKRETTLNAAKRILIGETGVSDVYLEQLMTFDDLKRDPTSRVVTVAWFALLPKCDLQLHTSEKYAGVEWRPVDEVKQLAYDHDEILRVAVERLRAKLGYTNIVWSLLPSKFTLTELQEVYEAILGRNLDKRNFRKKILAAGLLRVTGAQRAIGAHRPAALYAFKTKELVVTNIIS
jgi:8-oxo-dGTP diphosphatase